MSCIGFSIFEVEYKVQPACDSGKGVKDPDAFSTRKGQVRLSRTQIGWGKSAFFQTSPKNRDYETGL